MSAGWSFLMAGIGTYLIRLSAIALLARGVAVSAGLERTLRLIAPAVLAAIVANTLILDGGVVNTRVSWYAGAAVGALILRRTASPAWGMTVAMLAVYALQRLGVP